MTPKAGNPGDGQGGDGYTLLLGDILERVDESEVMFEILLLVESSEASAHVALYNLISILFDATEIGRTGKIVDTFDLSCKETASEWPNTTISHGAPFRDEYNIRVSNYGDAQFGSSSDDLLRLILERPRADLDLNSCNRMDSVRLAQGLRAAFRHANVVDKTFVDQALEGPDRVLDGDVVVHTGALEEIEMLLAAERSVNGGDATPQVFRA